MIDRKLAQLQKIVSELGSVVVAYSGGTDSTYLLSVCLDVLGTEPVLAVTADSPLTPRAEMADARALAAGLGAQHWVLPTDDLANGNIVANPPDRCYHCKFSRFGALLEMAHTEGLAYLVHGENADDSADYRPGSLAAQELGVRAPLCEAGLTKAEIRALSKERGLPNWNKPANACLASRFPYGVRLSAKDLARVEAAEEALQSIWGLQQLRVRDHYPVARVEVLPHEIARMAQPENRSVTVDILRKLGYRYIALDLAGYRMGSLNDDLESEQTA